LSKYFVGACILSSAATVFVKLTWTSAMEVCMEPLKPYDSVAGYSPEQKYVPGDMHRAGENVKAAAGQ
jgi:hypothetical protein